MLASFLVFCLDDAMREGCLIMVKVGTGVLTQDEGTLNYRAIEALASGLIELKALRHRVVLVSSGAVGAGVSHLGLNSYPEAVEARQAAAAIGQVRLIQSYQKALSPAGVTVAQVLLSSEDLVNEVHRDRASVVLHKLLEMERVLPIVNENDVVSLRELTKTDNDMLAANLATILGADRLILLTSVEGVLDQNGQLQREISSVDAVRNLVTGGAGRFSIGGMSSKLDAVEVAVKSGVSVVIGNGAHPERITGYLSGSSIGSYFRSCISDSGVG